MVVKDPEGKVIYDSGYKPAHSWVIQFLEVLGAIHSRPGFISITQVNGSEDYVYQRFGDGMRVLQLGAGVNNSDYGIVVGDGDTPPTNTDFCLEAQILEGSGAGQLTHGVMGIAAPAVVLGNVDLVTNRVFTNNSGTTITVEEVGVYYRYYQDGDEHPFLAIRDVLSPTVDIPDKCSLTVYYTWRTTV